MQLQDWSSSEELHWEKTVGWSASIGCGTFPMLFHPLDSHGHTQVCISHPPEKICYPYPCNTTTSQPYTHHSKGHIQIQIQIQIQKEHNTEWSPKPEEELCTLQEQGYKCRNGHHTRTETNKAYQRSKQHQDSGHEQAEQISESILGWATCSFSFMNCI